MIDRCVFTSPIFSMIRYCGIMYACVGTVKTWLSCLSDEEIIHTNGTSTSRHTTVSSVAWTIFRAWVERPAVIGHPDAAAAGTGSP
jgi:hypothetical protein